MRKATEILILLFLIIGTLIQIFTCINYADAYTNNHWRLNNLAMCLLIGCLYLLLSKLLFLKGNHHV